MYVNYICLTVVFVIASYSTPSFPRKPTPSGSKFVPAGPSGMGVGFGKRPAPGLAFIKNKKKKTASLVKDFNFSYVDDEGQMVTVFPISINLSEVSEQFGQLSVPVICSAVEQELQDQGEVVRLVVVDARGQPIMDSSETRSKFFSYFLFHLHPYNHNGLILWCNDTEGSFGFVLASEPGYCR